MDSGKQQLQSPFDADASEADGGMGDSMRALLITEIQEIKPKSIHQTTDYIDGTTAENQLVKPTRLPIPRPGVDQVLIRVAACGICHTELDEIEGRTAPPHLPVVPGHQVIGRVVEMGDDVTKHKVGDRVGVGWIFSSDGSRNENLSPAFRATGRDVNGGYAEYMVVGEDYAYAIPSVFSDEEAAPLLCAGGVGYRSLMLTGLQDGQTLGLTGFGGSGHIVLSVAKHMYPNSKVYVFARSAKTQEFAIGLGADWAGSTTDEPPEMCDAIIDTTPAWTPILSALAVLKPGGRLVINAIRKENRDVDVLKSIDYAEHLWKEKEIKSVANVASHDLRDFLRIAAEIPIKPEVTVFQLDEANGALRSLKAGGVQGSFVLHMMVEYMVKAAFR
eukprot:CAMPEP_0178587308 /NCGR_PEP_ID=MMETSP0697-20121206/26380_1 /TAXON_ID=265572 /ORGANISM="Extubocellulus spinifer, Strain CCMP396" /LENGTH=387 /DNA_ID=CAMNT_0020223481 /DNA_START=291 /DNA_END=1452 /DNA_ORIENTATION=-